MEEALAAQEAARRALAGKASQAAAADATASDPHRHTEVHRADEHADGSAEPEQPEEQPAASEPERPHVGLAEVTELPEVSSGACLQTHLPTLHPESAHSRRNAAESGSQETANL